MSATRILSCATLVALSWVSPAVAADQALELAVKNPHMVGASHGTLVFGDQGVQYRTTDKKDARSWSYEDIKQVQILSPTRVVVRTYEDQGWTKMWVDRAYEFQITKGTVTPALVTFLLAKIARPVVTAVLPALDATLRLRVPVKHVRGRRGSNGALLLYSDALVYQSTQPDASRYWRFGDLASILTLDRYRLEVVAYEGGAGETRPFLFQLKTDLPPGLYDALWSALNPPPSLRPIAAADSSKGGR